MRIEGENRLADWHDKEVPSQADTCGEAETDLSYRFHGTRRFEEHHTKQLVPKGPCDDEPIRPISTYPTYVKLATLHANALRFAEMRGEGVVKRRFKVVRKYNNDRDSYMSEKTPIDHVWRKEIFIDFLNKKTQRSDDEEEMDVT
ncbi:unnamed protein product [Cylicostephanus goldi]|uniref:Uncharacterized protein n=1 Tax=Cylicostephanus goldi TaxID=71465 RepID=A0A3P7MXI1_CYLGO|nr:unnamed protein product [Cylicostephanus goldi]